MPEQTPLATLDDVRAAREVIDGAVRALSGGNIDRDRLESLL